VKKEFYCILFFIIISCSNLKYLDKYNGFKGHPKEIATTKYEIEYKDGLPLEKETFTNVITFDGKGRIITHKTYKSDGTLNNKGRKYIYDRYGNMIQEIYFRRDGSNLSVHSKYNKYGQIIESRTIDNNDSIQTVWIQKNIDIDRENRLSTTVHRSIFRSNKYDSTIQKFDDRWKLKELISYDSLGNKKSRIIFHYDKNGNKYQSAKYDNKDSLKYIFTTYYNENNDWIKVKRFYPQKNIFQEDSVQYDYDDKQNIIEERLYSEGKLTWITKNKIIY